MSHEKERGSALILVMILLVVLGAGAALALNLQLADTRVVGLVRQARDSMYCAEAGLNAARVTVGANADTWGAVLDADAANNPTWHPIRGDVGDGGDLDFEVTIRDNDDEFPPLANDPTRDNDLKVFVVSRCLKYPDAPREILELVSFEGQGNNYRNQSGQGSGNTGNSN